MEFLARVWAQAAGRVAGQMRFRLIVQPSVAIALAVRAGLKDAAANRPAYLLAVMRSAAERRTLLRDGWKDLARLCAIAFGLDTGFQLLAFHWFYLVRSAIVTCWLAIVPSLMARGPVTRVTAWMSRRALMLISIVVLGAAGSAFSVTPKYGVTVKAARHTNFERLKTYSWTTGWSIFDQTVDRRVVAAVDRELAASGLKKLDAEPSDIIVTYASLRRTDVDLKSKKSVETGLHREYAVGTLVVLLLEPRSRRELFRARVDTPMAAEPSHVAAQLDAAIAEMFTKYPTRKSGRRG
jgi:hypothetical protein